MSPREEGHYSSSRRINSAPLAAGLGRLLEAQVSRRLLYMLKSKVFLISADGAIKDSCKRAARRDADPRKHGAACPGLCSCRKLLPAPEPKRFLAGTSPTRERNDPELGPAASPCGAVVWGGSDLFGTEQQPPGRRRVSPASEGIAVGLGHRSSPPGGLLWRGLFR